jgi:hypothetical protein
LPMVNLLRSCTISASWGAPRLSGGRRTSVFASRGRTA